MKRLFLICVATAIGVAGLGSIIGCNSKTATGNQEPLPAMRASQEKTGDVPQGTGEGMTAMRKAAEAKKYLFALFLKAEDSQTSAMREVLEDVMEEAADRADSVEVNVTLASERAIVKKFDLDRAPMPLILAIAPNGAITGGFPTKIEKHKLLEAFATPCTEKCMRQLQENRLVFLCVQNGNTKSNSEAMKGVREFKADARFARATEIVMLDPADTAETSFLKDLQIDSTTETAVTVFLAPPGTPVAMYEGATNKDAIVATLEKAGSACGPGGCGPGGCPPK